MIPGAKYIIVKARSTAGMKNIGRIVTFERWIYPGDDISMLAPRLDRYVGDEPSCLCFAIEGLLFIETHHEHAPNKPIERHVPFVITRARNLVPLKGDEELFTQELQEETPYEPATTSSVH